jgi:hypothetical protein
MKKQTKKTKLTLTTQSLRVLTLTPGQLGGVVGGGSTVTRYGSSVTN